MSWQDVVFGLGGLFFAGSLIPTIRSKTAEVPISTSIPTSFILAVYVGAEWTVGLHLAAIAGVFGAAAWALIAVLRRPQPPRAPRCATFMSPGPPWYAAQCKRPPGHDSDHDMGTVEEAQKEWDASLSRSLVGKVTWYEGPVEIREEFV